MKELTMRRLLPLLPLFALGLAITAGAETLNMPTPIPAPDNSEPVMAPSTAQPPGDSAAPDATTTPGATSPASPGGTYSVRLPGRGMTMDQVEAAFGSPREKMPEVGDPPIIRWNYNDFTVYFEYQYVINAVSSRAKQ
jgi:hypothetical protein